MEKLVELLNKFEKEKIIKNWWYVDEDDEYFWRSIENWKIVNRDYDPDAHGFMKYYIISKDFEFIKRLVENYKIDLYELEKIWYEKIIYDCYWQYRKIVNYSDYEILLMLLAIKDDPLKFLSQIIK